MPPQTTCCSASSDAPLFFSAVCMLLSISMSSLLSRSLTNVLILDDVGRRLLVHVLKKLNAILTSAPEHAKSLSRKRISLGLCLGARSRALARMRPSGGAESVTPDSCAQNVWQTGDWTVIDVSSVAQPTRIHTRCWCWWSSRCSSWAQCISGVDDGAGSEEQASCRKV